MSARAPAPLWLAAFIAATITILVMAWGDLIVGGYLLGAVLVVCALTRLALADDSSWGLVIRSRWFDAASYLALAAAVFTIFASVKV